MNQKPPIVRTEHVDEPGIVGAKWWHQTLADESAKIARRSALKTIVVGGALVAGTGMGIASFVKSVSSSGLPDDAKVERKTSLDLQKDYGWSFGANQEALVFDGVTEKPFDPNALALLATSLEPARTDLSPYYVRTLFEAPYATPRAMAQLPPEQAEGYQPLYAVMKPIATFGMQAAYEKGKLLATLGPPPKTAMLVDLPGPEAVAFAAGAASAYDPVFLFDNWPHPRGVVKAHETLSAAAYYQPLFAKERATTASKPPLFVLDRRRLTPYTDDATQFDNRFVAKLPPAAAVRALDAMHVVYVVPSSSDTSKESDDLNDDLASYRAAGVELRVLSLDAIVEGFHEPSGAPFTPVPRATAYSSGMPSGGTARPRPPTFATTPVLVALGTGVILGARYGRNGSWNRSSGGSWG